MLLSIFPPKLDKSVPTLLLGGGGYNAQLTARLWTTLTAAALRAPALGPEIPADDQVDIKEYQHQLIILYVLPGTFFALQFFLEYGPSYEFEVNATGRAKWTDHNSQQHLQRIRETAKGAHVAAAFQSQIQGVHQSLEKVIHHFLPHMARVGY